MDQATLGTLYLPRASQEDGTLNGPSYARHTTYPEQVKRMGHSMDQATLGTLYLPRASQEDGTLNGPSYARHTILTQSSLCQVITIFSGKVLDDEEC